MWFVTEIDRVPRENNGGALGRGRVRDSFPEKIMFKVEARKQGRAATGGL